MKDNHLNAAKQCSPTPHESGWPTLVLQLLVLQLALKLLRFRYFPDRFVEVVLIDLIPVILDSEETTIES